MFSLHAKFSVFNRVLISSLLSATAVFMSCEFSLIFSLSDRLYIRRLSLWARNICMTLVFDAWMDCGYEGAVQEAESLKGGVADVQLMGIIGFGIKFFFLESAFGRSAFFWNFGLEQ